MDKICFVIRQYGLEVNGGAEYHCRMLAERLTDYYDVDVVTSKIIDYNTCEVYYNSDEDILNGVKVKRFNCQPFDRANHDKWRSKSKFSRKIRRNLYRLGLLKGIADLKPVWSLGIKNENELFKSDGFYSSEALEYLKNNHHQYRAIIPIWYVSPFTVYGSQIAPNKTILIPALHDESEAFRSMHTHVFTKVYHIAFNTHEETVLASKIFGNSMSHNSIVAVGVETDFDEHISFEEIQEKFNLPDQYIHYFGRVCESKMESLIPWFINYKEKYPNGLKLVLTGKLFQDKISHPDIIYTGFVTDAEKISLIKNATLVINPSKLESLSLLLLEAMNLGKTVLVNGKSEVMKGHAIRSENAAEFYDNEIDFQNKIQKYILNSELLKGNELKAIAYVQDNYNWDKILNKLRVLINEIS
jgi:glycosyltransferase involved in cell wall biosynthesis